MLAFAGSVLIFQRTIDANRKDDANRMERRISADDGALQRWVCPTIARIIARPFQRRRQEHRAGARRVG